MGKKFLVIGCGGLLLPWIIRGLVGSRYADSILLPGQIKAIKADVIVLGAAVVDDHPTDALRDRLDTAITLYKRGCVERLLLSGGHAEPAVMQAYIEQNGVPSDVIMVDHQGLRTFDSCYRAYHNIGFRRVLFVTQAFHLPRTLFLAEMLGFDAKGVIADQQAYRDASWYELREMLALIAAIRDVLLMRLRSVR